MSTIKISQLPSITGANTAADDLLPIVDSSLNITNKITREEFFKNIQSDVEIADKIVHSGDTNTSIRFPAADTVTVETSGAERLRIDSSGNLGLGVSPSARLHVYNATGGTVARLQTGTTANGNFLDFQNAASARQGIVGFIDSTNLYIHNDAAAAIIFDTSNTERVRIDASGNLLIGTSATGGSRLRISGLPTSSAGLSAGDVWNDGGTLKIV